MKPAAPFARLDPDQTWGALPGPGAAARPFLASKRRAIASRPKLGHALATDPKDAGMI